MRGPGRPVVRSRFMRGRWPGTSFGLVMRRAVATAVVVTTGVYGWSAITASPARADQLPPTTIDPTTFRNDAAKTCPAGQICVGGRQTMVHSTIPIDANDYAGVQSLQSGSEAIFRGIHGLDDNDERVYDWGQADVAGLMYARMLNIINTPAGDRTADENGAYHWFQQLVHKYQVDSAVNALTEYKNWQAQQCAYKPKAPTPTYDSGLGCHSLDDTSDPIVGAVAAGAKVPRFQDLQSWGAYDASMNLGGSTISLPDMRRMIEALVGAGAIVAGTTGALTHISLNTTETSFSAWIGGKGIARLELAEKAARNAIREGRVVSKFVDEALLTGGAAFVGTLGFAVFVIVAAVVALVLGIIGQVEAAQLPIDLKRAIDNANAAALPDLAGMVNSTTPDGSNLLFTLFAAQLQVNRPFALRATLEPSWHGDYLHSQSIDTSVSPAAPSGPSVKSKGLVVKSWGDPGDEITKNTPDGTVPTIRWLTDQGWFQESVDGGQTWTTDSSLRYLDWNGNRRTAFIQGDHFLDVTSDPNADPLACADATKCKSTPTLNLLDNDGTPISVTMDPSVTVPAVITTGPAIEGQASTFTDASDTRGLPVTYKWEFESLCAVGALCTKRLDIGQPHDPFIGKYVVTETGQTVQYTWPGSGTFHVRLTTTNAAGSEVSDEDIVVAKGADPTISLAPSELGPLFPNGGTATLNGCFTTAAGNYQSPTVTIDWGDGSSDTAQPPRQNVTIVGVGQQGPFVVQAGALTGCSGPWSFIAHHLYGAGTPTTPHAVSVTVNDGEGGSVSKNAGDVTYLSAADLEATSIAFTGSTSTFQGLPEFNEGDPAHLKIQFNLPPSKFGESVSVDWDQYGERTAFVTSCNITGCTTPTTFESDKVFWSAAGIVGDTIHTVTVVVLDHDGNVARQFTTQVAIKDVNPTVSNLTIMPSPAAQGDTVTLSGTVASINSSMPLAVLVTWPTLFGTPRDLITLPPSPSAQTFNVSQVVRDQGQQEVTVQVFDESGGTAFGSTGVRVNNTPPSPVVGPVIADEGSAVALNVLTGDPGDDHFTAMVDWGDGSTGMTQVFPTAGPNAHLTLSPHTYAVPGAYTASVQGLDNHGGSGTGTATVTVDNVAPVVTLNPAAGTRGTVTTLTGLITDPGPLDTFTGTVDWRDGTTPETFTEPAGTTAFSLTHTYTQGGEYPAQVALADNHGGTAHPASAPILVNGPPVFKADGPDDGVVGKDYGYQFAAKGYPQPTFALAGGSLPPGLTFGSDGFLSGNPTATGLYTFTLSASNTFGSQQAGPITMNVNSTPAFVADSPPADAVMNKAFSYTFVASGVPTPTFSSSGSLPPGLVLSATSGVLSGTPTTLGTFTFTVTAANKVDKVTSPPHTIVVKAPLTVTAPSLTRPYGSANPQLTPGYSGFLPGDGTAALATAPRCITLATPASLPAGYPITCSGGVSGKYAFTYVPGTLTVNMASSATGVSQSPSPAAFRSPVTLTASVTGALSVAGTVQFQTAAGKLGPPVAISAGKASLTTTGVLTGQPVTAVYSGDVAHTPSTGAITPAITFSRVVTGTQSGHQSFNGGTWLLNGTTVHGGITIGSNTSVVLVNATVDGGIDNAAGGSVIVQDGTVNGGISATYPRAVTLCNTRVNGAVTVSGASGFVLIGDPGDDGCGGNTIRGGVTLTSNHAGVELGHNSISGPTSVSGTTGKGPFADDVAAEIEGNTITGSLACSSNLPAPTNDSQPNVVSGARSGQCATPVKL